MNFFFLNRINELSIRSPDDGLAGLGRSDNDPVGELRLRVACYTTDAESDHRGTEREACT